MPNILPGPQSRERLRAAAYSGPMEYWYNVSTGQVEQGAQSSWKHLLGPYSSYAEATKAMERVKQNNEAWDNDQDDDAD